MTKVRPLHGQRKFDWKTRLEALVTATGQYHLDNGGKGTHHTYFALARHGMRFVVETRIWGRTDHVETTIRIYGRCTFITIMVKDYRLTTAKNILSTTDQMDDYQKLYSTLKRRINVMFADYAAATIMADGDDLYYVLNEKRNGL